jgi:hypothetical protein
MHFQALALHERQCHINRIRRRAGDGESLNKIIGGQRMARVADKVIVDALRLCAKNALAEKTR